jgi:hypothetical protein
MPVISDEDVPLVVRAVEHFSAYLIASRRKDSAYQALADRLKRKPADQETTTTEKRKKA